MSERVFGISGWQVLEKCKEVSVVVSIRQFYLFTEHGFSIFCIVKPINWHQFCLHLWGETTNEVNRVSGPDVAGAEFGPFIY